MAKDLRQEYFDWIYHIVCGDRFSKGHTFRKLLSYLHNVVFTWEVPMDENRAEDGKDLRWRFAYETHHQVYDELDGPCSVLEMMVSLAIRCEESIMDDPSVGDRTGQWFWRMITNLGLGGMTDYRFDEAYTEEIVDRFLYREYLPDGRGGLFTVRHPEYDMRDVDIWTQLCYFLNDIA